MNITLYLCNASAQYENSYMDQNIIMKCINIVCIPKPPCKGLMFVLADDDVDDGDDGDDDENDQSITKTLRKCIRTPLLSNTFSIDKFPN